MSTRRPGSRRGQASVSPTSAQAIYATTPLWSAMLSAALLREEVGGPLTWAGGAAVVAAGLLAAAAERQPKQGADAG